MGQRQREKFIFVLYVEKAFRVPVLLKDTCVVILTIGRILVECVIEHSDLKKVGRDMKVVIYRYKRTTKILLSDICFP